MLYFFGVSCYDFIWCRAFKWVSRPPITIEVQFSRLNWVHAGSFGQMCGGGVDLECLIVALSVLMPSADEIGDEGEDNESGQHTSHNDRHQTAPFLVQVTSYGWKRTANLGKQTIKVWVFSVLRPKNYSIRCFECLIMMLKSDWLSLMSAKRNLGFQWKQKLNY